MSTSEPQRSRVYLWTLDSLRLWASLPILLKNSTASPYTTTATTTTIKNQAKSTLHLRAQIRIDRVDADNVSLVASTKSGRLHICITWGAFCCTTPGSTLSAWCYRHRVSSSWQRRLRRNFVFNFDSALATGLTKEKAMEIHISIIWRSTQYCGILCAKVLVWKWHARSECGCSSGVA